MSDIVERLNEACVGHPAARIPWPHRLLHEARDEIKRLRTEIELLHAELRVTKKLGLAALQDAMRQAGTGEER